MRFAPNLVDGKFLFDENCCMRNQRATEVGAGSLLRGAFYAAENAWRFLRDAVLLFRNERYSSALILATYCLEEVGRASIYLQHQKNTDVVTVKFLTDECRDHALKLAQAKIPVSVGESSADEPPIPGSAQKMELAKRLLAKRERLEKAVPKKTKDMRFKSLYVDPLDDGIRWNQPSQTNRDVADYWLGTADVTYRFLRHEVLTAALSENLDEAFWGRTRQPKLLEPDWDIWDWAPASVPDSRFPVRSYSKTR